MLLADWERAQAAVERDEVLEDPLALAAALAQGQAIAGMVVDVDAHHAEAGPSGKRSVLRPLITLQCEDICPFPVGTALWWTRRPGGLCVEVVSAEPRGSGSTVVVKVVGGMKGELPRTDSEAVFSIFTTSWVPPAALPRETPWTHVPDPGRALDAKELDDGPPLDEALELGGVA